MPMPHRTQQQLIKRRLVGKDGAERIRELRAILADLPGYRNGPYADLRKWVEGELTATRTRKKVVHRDSLAVRREGAAQIALVGPPNAGKSSLLQALSAIQIRTGDYAFTTTRPVAATTRLGGVLVQLVEIPGLIEGAADDRGGGRALLGVLRNADAILFCHACDRPLAELETIRDEVAAAGIELPRSWPRRNATRGRRRSIPSCGHTGLRARRCEPRPAARELWAMTGLVRVHLRDGGDPVALEPPATVLDVADTIHHELASAVPAPGSGGRRRGSRDSRSAGSTS